jgi:tetratricopeptide (TPR) repeat protein
MPVSHPPIDAELERFVRGLLGVAQLCRPVPPYPEYPDSAYDGPIARAMAAALGRKAALQVDRERVERVMERVREAPDALTGLSRLPGKEVAALHGRLRVEILVRCSFAERFRRPRNMLRLALMACDQAETLAPAVYGRSAVADDKARAWAELANAHRVNDDLAGSRRALRVSCQWLDESSGDPLLAARIESVAASLQSDRGEVEAALATLDRVIRIGEATGESHLVGQALVQQGIYQLEGGDGRTAQGLLQAGLARLESGRDPKISASGALYLLVCQAESGKLDQAALTSLQRSLRKQLADEPLGLIKIRWMEGVALAGSGDLSPAATALTEARTDLLSHDRKYDAALAGLDLAAVWQRSNRKAKARRLAQEAFGTLQGLGVPREARRAAQYL